MSDNICVCLPLGQLRNEKLRKLIDGDFMNFLLIVPQFNPRVLFYDFPLGLAYISGAMKKAGLNVSCLNLNHCQHTNVIEAIAGSIITNDIDVVCTGGLITHYSIIGELLGAVKKIKPSVINIVGGGLVTCEPELVFDGLDMDYGVLGEGEITIGELAGAIMDGREPRDVKGIIYRNSDGEMVKTEARGPIENLSSLAWPDYQGLGLEYYLDNQLPYDSSILQVFDEPRVLPVISSRSCPYRCSFCYHPLGNKYRSRELDDFFSEIEYLINHHDVNGLLVLDELLCHNKGRLEEFCERIKPFHVRWMAQLRVDSVDEKLLGMLKDANCYYLSYGIESACDEILKSMQKHTTVAQIEKALELTYDAGISSQGNLLFSDRSETLETAEESLQWAMEHWYYRLQLAPLFALPRSSDYLYALEQGIIEDKMEFIKRGCQFVNISKMSENEMASILQVLSSTSLNLLLLPEEYEITAVGHDPRRDSTLYEIDVKCPHCERFVHYTNVCLYQGIFNNRFLHCKYCHGRFDIMLEWFDHFTHATIASGQSFLEHAKEIRGSGAKWCEPFRAGIVMKAPKKSGHPYCMFSMDAEGANEADRKFAILVPLTNVYRKVGVSIGKALARAGADACVFEIPGVTERLLQKCDKGLLESFYSREGITDTVAINGSREDLNVAGSIRHHRLVQIADECGAGGDECDFVYETCVPDGLAVATDYDRFFREPGGEDSYEAEIGVTFDYMADRPPIRPEMVEVISPYLDAVRKRVVDEQSFVLSIEQAGELLDWAEKQVGRRLEGPRGRLAQYIATDFVEAVMRWEVMRRLRYVTKKHRWRLRIVGRYWDDVPNFSEYSMGFVGYGEPMARFLQSCKTVIHLDGKNNVQLLDAMGCGAFCITRKSSGANAGNSVADCFDDDVLRKFSNEKELDRILAYYIDEHPEERVSLARAGSDIVKERFTYDSLVKRLLAGCAESVGVAAP